MARMFYLDIGLVKSEVHHYVCQCLLLTYKVYEFQVPRARVVPLKPNNGMVVNLALHNRLVLKITIKRAVFYKIHGNESYQKGG